MGWDVSDDISSQRPPKRIYEVFVGRLDSEYVQKALRPAQDVDDLYHASLTSRHVPGDAVFHELPISDRKQVVRRNRERAFKTKVLSYQLSVYSAQLGLQFNEAESAWTSV